MESSKKKGNQRVRASISLQTEDKEGKNLQEWHLWKSSVSMIHLRKRTYSIKFWENQQRKGWQSRTRLSPKALRDTKTQRRLRNQATRIQVRNLSRSRQKGIEMVKKKFKWGRNREIWMLILKNLLKSQLRRHLVRLKNTLVRSWKLSKSQKAPSSSWVLWLEKPLTKNFLRGTVSSAAQRKSTAVSSLPSATSSKKVSAPPPSTSRAL